MGKAEKRALRAETALSEAGAEIGRLTTANKALAGARDRAIARAQANAEALVEIRRKADELDERLGKTREERDDAIQRLDEANIAARLRQDPVDLARRATRGTLRVFDDLMEASGGPRRFHPDRVRDGEDGDGDGSGAPGPTSPEALLDGAPADRSDQGPAGDVGSGNGRGG